MTRFSSILGFYLLELGESFLYHLNLIAIVLSTQIAPVIHEWTYDSMCHDLLDLDGNKYVYEVPVTGFGDPCYSMDCFFLINISPMSGS